ncbi:unnamed protein product [Heligmosomoides polygyrus]|uniref:Uncharacterized protein n=1 Tax=Heligmosomoides polygyrus TaxID=6339 RepID=A0A3P8F512_HELPZ|nr:unnamed protein product [Heligmosomoides polygyrus]
MKVTLLLQVGVGEAKLDRVGVRVGDMLSPPQRPSNCFGSEAHLELGGARGVGQSGGRLLNKDTLDNAVTPRTINKARRNHSNCTGTIPDAAIRRSKKRLTSSTTLGFNCHVAGGEGADCS